MGIIAILLKLGMAISIPALLYIWQQSFQNDEQHTHSPNNNIWSKCLWPALLFLLTLALFYPFARLDFDVAHHASMFKPAHEWLQGYMPFKDNYYQYGFLCLIIQTLSLMLFGDRVLSLQIMTVIFYGGSFVLMDLFWARRLKMPLRIAAALVGLSLAPFFLKIMFPWSSVYALFFSLLTLIFCDRVIDKWHPRDMLLMGLALGATFWCRQPLGILLFIALIGSCTLLLMLAPTLRRRITKLLAFNTLGALLISAPLLLWLYIGGALKDWWIQDIVWILGKWAFQEGGESSGGMMLLINTLLPRGLKAAGIFWAWLPALALGLFFLVGTPALLRRKLSSHQATLLIYLVLAITSWHQYFPQNDMRHIYWAALPLVYLPFLWMQSWPTLNKRHRHMLLAALIIPAIILVSYELTPRISVGRQRLTAYQHRISGPFVMSGFLLSSKDQLKALSDFNMELLVYRGTNPLTPIITTLEASRANLMFATFLERQGSFGPILTGADESPFLYGYYDYENRLADFIQEKRPLIYAERPLEMEGYQLLFQETLAAPITYMMSENIYLYGPL